MGLIRFVQKHNENVERKNIRMLEQQKLRTMQQQSSDRRCPNCGRSIPFDANLCPYCCKDLRNVSKKEENTTKGSSIEILKIRYAKGEITKKEFEQMKKDLED